MGDVDAVNAGYAGLILDEYLDDPEAVAPEWRALFEAGEAVSGLPGLDRLLTGQAPATLRPGRRGAGRAGEPAVDAVRNGAGNGNGAHARAVTEAAEPAIEARDEDAELELLGGVAAGMALVKAFRMHGHLAANLDPLGSAPVGDPALDPMRLHPPLTPELQARIPASVLRVHVDGQTLAETLPQLRATYCGAMAYEIEHISDHFQRVWLRKAIESWRYRKPLPKARRRELYARLCEVEALEHYLRRAFIGQKQFSVEGLDVLIPMLDSALTLARGAGAREAFIGMAHRGRLNVLAHIVGVPYVEILREFEGERTIEGVAVDAEGGTGDVKYHLGAEGVFRTPEGKIRVTLAANPSHLEAVDPVVEGMTRARQTDRSSREGAHHPSVAIPILLHGDAAFAGQGIVAETLNLYALEGYGTGGTLHVIANNQVGFTTDPIQARSTRYSSDLAKGYDTPIVHVNADDPEAALSAVSLALAYRERFGHDVVIDLVGYRRFGHNEQDEPAYTQPLMSGQIAHHPTVRELYGQRLLAEGVLDPAEVESLLEEAIGRVRAAHEILRSSFADGAAAALPDEHLPREDSGAIHTAAGAKRLRRLTEQLLQVPEGFTVHPKLAETLARRRSALDEGGIDWGHAEALAFATLLRDGVPIRFTGQDSERGTFSHRHLVLHDAQSGEIAVPMHHLEDVHASFEVHNSPLSELACVGFEAGYSTAAPEALVLWEAQFGDFANAAQTIIDQFITSGIAKWGQRLRLSLLLPHGYEGNGPEHSSARLERFLQLAAQENIRIASPSTAAQYFHLLRRQALDPVARPLIVMTPKGLLRLREASSSLEELSEGSFAAVLDAPVADKSAIRRLALCSGKIYYDVLARRSEETEVAVARLEQLYPFPVGAMHALVGSYPALEEIVWVQEEPQNMGAWRTIRHRLEEAAGGLAVRYIGRPWRASTAEGAPRAHAIGQERIARAVYERS